ncbi:MAG TPA: helicase-related protein [Polyangiaceae bacterium]|nr:helicase-related protein [Polyangiaceae bacterium]
MSLVGATESVALLGPTNTGKTHRAVERMLEHTSGMIGLPLRLLAREVYDRVSARIGEDRVALVTGEEKRVPRRPDYWVCTTEAMPMSHEVDFVAVDEVQLASHDERGHVFTERLLHARGRRESWFMGSSTMRPLMEKLVPAAKHQEHPRLSRLSFAGSSKLQRLPKRSVVVAFSVPELYQLAHRLRVLRGGAAVVLGALSPRARNAQVAMFQAGEVDYLVATDAIGMGLNLDVGHVAFASLRKFDGRNARGLEDAELAQIAGRAGRYLRDGSFGTLSPLELPLHTAQRIEQHRFEPLRRIRYRNADLDFSSPSALLASLEAPPPAAYMAAVPDALDLHSLRALLEHPRVREQTRSPEALERLWAVCQIPDFRHILFEVHLELLRDIFLSLADGPLSNDFLAARTQELAETGGDVDAIVARIARLRTWAFVANSAGFCAHSAFWSAHLSTLEDRLSDALHSGLVSTFVEKQNKAQRTARSALRRQPLAPEEREVDRHHPFAALSKLRLHVRDAVGPSASEPSSLEDLLDAPHEAFEIDARGRVSAKGVALGRLVRGASVTTPNVELANFDELGGGVRLRLQRRLLAFARDAVARPLHALAELRSSEQPALRAIAYQIEGGLGTASAHELQASLAVLTRKDFDLLQRCGVFVGHLSVFLSSTLRRPALDWRTTFSSVFEPTLVLPPPGKTNYETRALTSIVWRRLGYIDLGPRACRVDLAERAAQSLLDGASEIDALRCLSIPKRDAPRVARAVRERLPPRAGAA